jgi:glycosyltransferase involved in cell wall biosynthesis
MLKKISIIEPVGGHGGLDFYNIGLSEAISNQKIEVYLYTSTETVLDKEINNLKTNIKKYYNNLYNNDNKYIRGLRYIYGTLRSVIHAKKNKVQLAHFHIFNFSKLEIFNISIFKLFGIQVVATIHDVDKLSNLDSQHSTAIYEKFEKLLDKVFVHTEFTQQALVNNFKNTKKEEILVVPHGDMDFVYNIDISKEEALKKLNLEITPDKKIILLFGQIKKVKGLDVLLEAYGQIYNRYKESTVVLIAGKLWKNNSLEYEKIIEKFNMQDNVLLHLEYIENKDVPLYFKIADIVTLPYKKVYNSGVILRAMDYGSTVLVSDLEALTKNITHNKNGFVFKSEDSNDMAKKLEILLDDENLRERLLLNSKKYIENNFSWNIIGKKMVEAYNLSDGENR